MPDLKQSTATTRMVFMTDSSDHVTGKTGLTLTITASKAGGAFASITPTVVDRGSGWYSLALTTAHTDTLGDLAIHATATGADPTDKLFAVVAGSLDADVSSRLAPTVASRTLDVSATGEAGIDLANVGSPTTTLNLSGTTISTGQGIASVSGSVASVTGAVGSVTGAVGSVTGNVGGDVAGKVLGGGSGTITGTGVNANIASVDPALNADGTAQAGGSLTITLASSASAVDDAYKGRTIDIVAGTGIGQSRKIAGYVGSTRVATVDLAWVTQPDGTSKYAFGAYVPAATTSLGSTAPAGWINTAAFAAGTTVPRTTLVDTVTTYTGNTPQTGDAFGRLGVNGAGLTAIGDTRLGYLTGNVALATQIPSNFTTGTFASAGVFATAALANAPSGGGGGSDPWNVTLPGSYATGKAGNIVGNLATQADLGTTIAATPVSIKTGGITSASYASGAAPATPPTTSAITTAVVAGMSTAPVGSVANLTPLLLPGGTVAASPSPTTTAFKGTGTLNTTSAAYAPTAKRVRFVYWQTGNNAGETSSIASYAGAGSFVLDLAPTGTIVAGDTFLVI